MHAWLRSVLAAVALNVAAPVLAATCNDPGGFEKRLGDIRREAAAQGISQPAINAGLSGIAFDPAIIRRDRAALLSAEFRAVLGQDGSGVSDHKGTALLKRHAGLLAQIERQYGVPGPIVVAIWGLEGDFGAATGKLPTIQALATLAYDCRRSELFTQNLFDALRIVQRGDLRPAEMRGAWAGELGQTQFMASNYYKFAVDFDGDGRRDLFRSTPDVLASTANYLRAHGCSKAALGSRGPPITRP